MSKINRSDKNFLAITIWALILLAGWCLGGRIGVGVASIIIILTQLL